MCAHAYSLITATQFLFVRSISVVGLNQEIILIAKFSQSTVLLFTLQLLIGWSNLIQWLLQFQNQWACYEKNFNTVKSSCSTLSQFNQALLRNKATDEQLVHACTQKASGRHGALRCTFYMQHLKRVWATSDALIVNHLFLRHSLVQVASGN